MNQQPDASRLAGGEERSWGVYILRDPQALYHVSSRSTLQFIIASRSRRRCAFESAQLSHPMDRNCHKKYRNTSLSSGYRNFATEQRHRSGVNGILT